MEAVQDMIKSIAQGSKQLKRKLGISLPFQRKIGSKYLQAKPPTMAHKFRTSRSPLRHVFQNILLIQVQFEKVYHFKDI